MDQWVLPEGDSYGHYQKVRCSSAKVDAILCEEE